MSAFLLLALLLAPPPTHAPGSVSRASTASSKSKPSKTGPYVLPPQLRVKARLYSRAQYTVYFGSVALSLAVFSILWLSGIGLPLRNLAERASRKLFVQSAIVVVVLVAIASVVQFPLDFYSGFILEHRFGLSTQTFSFWLSDWGKTLGLTLVLIIPIVWAFYRLARRFPKTWWIVLWLALIPPALAVIYAGPYVVEPLFYHFTPLQKTHPALTARIEQMLRHAGVNIPRSKIYESNASARTRAINAYVSGVGPSKHVVVWDTALSNLTPDELLLVLAHETGHYMLHHIIKEFAADEAVALALLLLAFAVLDAAGRRKRTSVIFRELTDLASLPWVMLVAIALSFVSSPVYCAISRHYEHQADQYALELAFGVVPDPNAAMASAFEVLGARDLSDPNPNPFIVFWLFTHPPLALRIRFAERYKPWAAGRPMRFVRGPRG
jgi:STE24 endopeptidase